MRFLQGSRRSALSCIPDTAKMMDWDTLFWDLRRLVDQTREDVQEQTEVRVLDRLRLLGQKALNAGRGNYP